MRLVLNRLSFLVWIYGWSTGIAPLHSQKLYGTFYPEMILSGVEMRQNNLTFDYIPRFSPFFNIQNVGHTDIGRFFGFYGGLSIKNIGFILNQDTLRHKFRSYNIGAPIALKLGSMEKQRFLFFGFEPEMTIHYKEKILQERTKTKESAWFSRKTPRFMYNLFAGIQFNEYMGIKIRYYLTNFLDPTYTQTRSGITTKPYEDIQSQIFSISLYWVAEDPNRKYHLQKQKTSNAFDTQTLLY